MALAPLFSGPCRTGFVILTAKPIAGHDAKGQRREPRPGRSRCRRRPRPGSGPETGTSPGSSARPAPGRWPCPRTLRQSRPLRPRPPRRSSKRLPETSVSLPGITLSDEGGQGERARTRPMGGEPVASMAVRVAPERVIHGWSSPHSGPKRSAMITRVSSVIRPEGLGDLRSPAPAEYALAGTAGWFMPEKHRKAGSGGLPRRLRRVPPGAGVRPGTGGSAAAAKPGS